MEEKVKKEKLNKKIERELFIYCHQLSSYGDMEDILGVSERSYYQYCRELKICKARMEAAVEKQGYDYTANVSDKHMERLYRLVMMVDYIESMPKSRYGTSNVLIEDWEKHIRHLPIRTRQRDFLVLQNIGYKIVKREKRYLFYFDDESFWGN